MLTPNTMVSITTSELGTLYGVGKVVDTFGDSVKVVFKDTSGKEHLGVYTISKHDIKKV